MRLNIRDHGSEFVPIEISITLESPAELVDLMIRMYPASDSAIFVDRAQDILRDPSLMAEKCVNDKLYSVMYRLAKNRGLLRGK